MASGAIALAPLLEQARGCARRGADDAAKRLYLEILGFDSANRDALIEIAGLALAHGHRDAARTALTQACAAHPDDTAARVTLGNMALEDADPSASLLHFEAALRADPDCFEADQGLARAYAALGWQERAASHRDRGFGGHAISGRRYRGPGQGVDMLYLAATTGGNVRFYPWIDDRTFAVTVIYPEYFEAGATLPPHRLIVNAIGDADLCGGALARAQEIVAGSVAPVVNHPTKVRQTGRETIAHRAAGIANLVAPRIARRTRAEILADAALEFPLLVRSPGFHTGLHFVLVERREALPGAIAALPGDELLIIPYLDATGPDGLSRKYRVMFIAGNIYPWHLAISRNWCVHYFSSDMTADPAFRAEEKRFLDDMPGVLGARAMAALGQLRNALQLDFAGADFALDQDGNVLLFEANAAMTMNPPPPDPLWDYRRDAAHAAQAATRHMFTAAADRAFSEGQGALPPGRPPKADPLESNSGR